MNWKIDAVKHALEEFPREACGLVVRIENGGAYSDPFYMRCRNIAVHHSNFVMEPEDYAKAEDAGKILGVFHSHPNAHPKPSQGDLVSCEASGLPWWIYALPSSTWSETFPTGYVAPLLGREYVPGVLDCYSIIRDWYKIERGIELLDFERREDSFDRGENLYLENFQKAGFEPFRGPLEVGDVILMQILKVKFPNHGAVYIGHDKMIHHLAGRLSSREIYGGYWRKCTRLVIRYQGKR